MNPRILVATADYPDNNGSVSLMYVHIRNQYYCSHGIDVTVLNFGADGDYVIDGIPVITLATYKRQVSVYDLLICHAPNIRNHFLFLQQYGTKFPAFIFFFHGHEVLKVNKVYSAPYDFQTQSWAKNAFQNLYDDFKLMLWRHFYIRVKDKSTFIFVSNWMLNEFLKWTKIPYETINQNSYITYNSIGEPFEKAKYDWKSEKQYDFLTIRSNLDGSKYAIDIVNRIAKANPHKKFLVIGKGKYFNYHAKADNLIWLNKTLSHLEIIGYIQKSRCALMPTRTDAQGLMMCEMAATGMPVITSDLPVCHEVFDDFPNVRFVKNETTNYKNLGKIAKELEAGLPYEKNDKYNKRTTCDKEIKLIEEMTGKRVH